MSLLTINNIVKNYGDLTANDNISFTINQHSIHALLGENGAGKSTLVKMIYGIVKPDSGSMHYNNALYQPQTPFDARHHGIAMVFQHFSLFETLSVKDNIYLAFDGHIKPHKLDKLISNIANEYDFNINPHHIVGDLSVGERQRVEIMRCLLQNPTLLIMDEPTSVLAPQEIDSLFDTLRRLRDKGCSILYISHKLEEIRQLCDQATILRQGKHITDIDPTTTSKKELAELMLGRKLNSITPVAVPHGAIMARIKNITYHAHDMFGTSLHDISITLRAHTITAIAGVAGNGQDELMAVLMGEQQPNSGHIIVNDTDVTRKNPHERRQYGIEFIPEERLGHASVASMSLWHNILLCRHGHHVVSPTGIIKKQAAMTNSQHVIDNYNVAAPSSIAPMQSLSGGNIQKYIIGRSIELQPNVLIVAQPTWGVDAGSAQLIHQELCDMAANGSAILIISQDLDELLLLSHHIHVIAHGRLSDSMPTQQVNIHDIGVLMGAQNA